jgi:trehalose synthase
MLRPIASADSSLEAYAGIFGAATIERIRAVATSVQGARVLHLSASSAATHDAQLIQAVVSLQRNLGLDVHWKIAHHTDEEMSFAMSLYEAIEGEGRAWTPELNRRWHSYAHRWAQAIDRRYDFFIVHDPQLLTLRREVSRRLGSRAHWIWHCHLDLADCDQVVARKLTDELAGYDMVAFEHPRFAGDVGTGARTLIPPVIDPLSGRNVQLPVHATDQVLRRLNLNSASPLAVQVSRFDGWDDPQWVVYTYEAARKLIPDIQFALVSTSDPPTDEFSQIAAKMGNKRIRFLSSRDVGDVEVNALQGAAVVAMQQGVRKGFSPALLEASWKGRPVLAADGGALCDQVVDGSTGYVFKTFDDAAERIAQLVNDPGLADALGFAGHRLVRENHLVVRWVEKYLNLLSPVAQVVV